MLLSSLSLWFLASSNGAITNGALYFKEKGRSRMKMKITYDGPSFQAPHEPRRALWKCKCRAGIHSPPPRVPGHSVWFLFALRNPGLGDRDIGEDASAVPWEERTHWHLQRTLPSLTLTCFLYFGTWLTQGDHQQRPPPPHPLGKLPHQNLVLRVYFEGQSGCRQPQLTTLAPLAAGCCLVPSSCLRKC